MVEKDEAAVFPVVLFDGERDTDVGDVEIHSTLDFKRFQMTLSQMIGISYNNLTIYLVDSNKSKISLERRKILITSKVNFSVLVRERNCYFLVVLKRSRRDRRRKPNKQSSLEFLPANFVPPRDFLGFSLNQLDMNGGIMPANGSYYYDGQFHDLQMQRENYMNTILNLNPNYGFGTPLNVDFPRIEEAYSRVQSRRLCEDCTKAEKQGKKAPFHLCVYDDVVAGGFRSPVGPVSRPR